VTVWGRFADRIDVLTDVMHDWDVRAMAAISDARWVRRASRLFIVATYLGDGYIWLGLALGLLAFGRTPDRWNVLAGLAITVANLVAVRLLKTLFSRERPEDVAEEMRGRVIDAYSFPSGHATTSFGMAWLVAVSYPVPLVQAAVYAVATVIAFSRIALREHYLSDVVAGGTLGTLVAASVLHFFR
jgi:undecaprenyl-diphosphatase